MVSSILTANQHVVGSEQQNDVQRLWEELKAVFKRHKVEAPTLERVSILSEVAISVVFSATGLDDSQQHERHTFAKDYAECAALYGYVLGQADAQAAQMAVAGD